MDQLAFEANWMMLKSLFSRCLLARHPNNPEASYQVAW